MKKTFLFWWDFFRSLQLTLWSSVIILLLLGIGAFSLSTDPALYQDLYTAPLLPWLTKTGWENFSATWWLFAALVTLTIFAINTTICTIDRLQSLVKLVRNPTLTQHQRFWQTDTITLQLQQPMSQVKESFLKLSKKRRFNCRVTDKNETSLQLYGEKWRLSLFGPHLAHIGFLCFLIGQLLTGYAKEKHPNQALPLLSSMQPVGADYHLTLEKLVEEKSKNSYRPTVTIPYISVPAAGIKNHRLAINNPLELAGTTLYQNSFTDWPTSFTAVFTTPDKKSIIKLLPNNTITLGSYQLHTSPLYPDFGLDQHNQPTSYAQNPENPAIFIEISKGKQNIAQGFIISNHPNFQQISWGKQSLLQLVDITFTPCLLFDLVKDPGVNWAFTGSCFLLIGLFLSIIVDHRRIWVQVCSQQAGETSIYIRGKSIKNPVALEQELAWIGQQLVQKQGDIS